MGRPEDVADVLTDFIFGFKSLGLEQPPMIVLRDHKAGMALVLAIQKSSLNCYVPDSIGKQQIWPDGSKWIVVEFMATKIAWPADPLVAEGPVFVTPRADPKPAPADAAAPTTPSDPAASR